MGNELYSDNVLDRGHIARRADLCWGGIAEAQQANADSFYYTNIAPQHQAYNQSSRQGLWGELEDHVFAQAGIAKLRLSVQAVRSSVRLTSNIGGSYPGGILEADRVARS